MALLLSAALAWGLTTHNAVAAGPAPVNLGTSGNFVILTKTGITNVPTSKITGNIGASPITAAAMDNVTCAEMTGTIYGADVAYTGSGVTTCFKGAAADNTLVANAVLDMGTAYADALGRTTPDFTELGAGDISGLTLAPGLYKWSTGVLINTDVTLSGGPNDVWIFQIAGNVTQAAATHVLLAGGAQAKNIFWQVAGGAGVAMGTTAHFEGVILAATGVTLTSGATVNGRLLAQTAVTLIMNTITQPAAATSSTVVALVGLPDLNANGVVDMTVLRLRAGSVVAEIRDGLSGALLKNFTFLGSAYTPVAAAALPDTDGNGISELAVLATRNSDGRVLAEICNVSGATLPRYIWFPAGFSAVAMRVVNDADKNGVAELAVLLSRNSDGRGLVQVTNAFGTPNTQFLWATAGFTVSGLQVVGDSDGNGVPEVAMLSRRTSDGLIVVQIRNASGVPNPHGVSFMAGNTAVDFTAVPDKDLNGIPEVAVLSTRNSDGRQVVEIKNAAGAALASTLWMDVGLTSTQVEAVNDADKNGVPEVAILSTRNSDGRIRVDVKNAAGLTAPHVIWYSPGFGARRLAILNDADLNGIQEAGVLMIRNSDGRVLVEARNAAGGLAPKDYWFAP
jgi:hypothetical protein